MALMSRLDLEALFKNGKRPSEKDFAHLIESTLNKRDDQFMGRWKSGRIYHSGDVVIYNRELWEYIATEETCSKLPPSKGDWQQLIILESDGDWKIFQEQEVMFAQVYNLIGIGREYDPENGDIPEAKLDITEQGKSRYLIFPKPGGLPVLSLFQLESTEEEGIDRERTYYLTGLDNNEVSFLTDTSAYVFRKGEYCEAGDEVNLKPKEGDILVTIRSGNSGLAQVGIGTAEPAGMLDITDENRGQFLFNPEDKKDPAFSIINLDPDTAKNYLAMGVGEKNSVFISDAPRGFIFRKGAEYDEYCAQTDINQSGKGLMILFLDDHKRTRVGIGTENPKALIDATDDSNIIFQVNPEHKNEPSVNLIHAHKTAVKEYVAFGIGDNNQGNGKSKKDKLTILISNSSGGYRINQGTSTEDFLDNTKLDQGETNVAILADGKVGIGTIDPETKLEVTDHRKSGRFLLNVDEKAPNPAMAIINIRPGSDKANYLTMGAGNRHAIFITNSDFGFSFRMGGNIGNSTNNEIQIEQKSETLLSIRSEYIDPKKIHHAPEMRVFPENEGKFPGEVHIFGVVGIEKEPEEYELDIEGKTRSIITYQVADPQKMSDLEPIENALDKLCGSHVVPKQYKWDRRKIKNAPEGTQFGFDGFELKDDLPEVVRQTAQEDKETDTISIAYQNMVPLLTKAIQELNAEVKALKEEIEELKKPKHSAK